jgi:hypothetical protein
MEHSEQEELAKIALLPAEHKKDRHFTLQLGRVSRQVDIIDTEIAAAARLNSEEESHKSLTRLRKTLEKTMWQVPTRFPSGLKGYHALRSIRTRFDKMLAGPLNLVPTKARQTKLRRRAHEHSARIRAVEEGGAEFAAIGSKDKRLLSIHNDIVEDTAGMEYSYAAKERVFYLEEVGATKLMEQVQELRGKLRGTEDVCAVCLEPVSVDDGHYPGDRWLNTRLPCGHLYHVKCSHGVLQQAKEDLSMLYTPNAFVRMTALGKCPKCRMPFWDRYGEFKGVDLNKSVPLDRSDVMGMMQGLMMQV